MSDTYSNPLGFIFGGGDAPTYEELKRRRAIAAALASRQRGYPKNIGEGLTAFGEGLGEAIGDWKLREQERRHAAGEAEVVRNAPPSVYTPPVTDAPPPRPTVAPPGPVSEVVDPTAGAMAMAPEAEPLPVPEVGSTEPIVPRPVQTTSFSRPPDPAAAAEIPFEGPVDDPMWARRSRAIGGIETGGSRDPYREVGIPTKGGQAQGKYQMMSSNLPGWTRKALGYELTPEEFRENPNAQEITFRKEFGDYAKKYGEEGAARAWYAGERNMNKLGARDAHGRLTVANYGTDYMRRLGLPEGEAPGPRDAVAAALVQQGRPAAPGATPEAVAGPLPVQPEQPPGETEITQQAIMRELLGGAGRRGPQTAALGRAGVASDAPLPGLGQLPGLEGSVRDRQGIYDAVQGQQAPTIAPDVSQDPTRVAQVAQAPDPTVTDIRPAPDMPPSRKPIPPASAQTMDEPGPPPVRPQALGPSKAQEYWRAQMNSRSASPELKARAEREYNAEEQYRRELQSTQANEYQHARSRWEAKTDEYKKFVREAPTREIEQDIKRLAIEAEQWKAKQRPTEEAKARADLDIARANLEELQYKRGIPRQQTRDKTDLEIAQARRNLGKPDEISVGGTVMERPPAAPGQPPQPYAVPPGAPRVKEDLTETQAKATTFLIRTAPDLDRADREMGYGKALTNFKDATIDALGPMGTGNMMVSDEYRRARDALGNWGSAFLTHVSGAAVSPSEALRNLPAFIPRPGDNEQDLLDKAERRRSMTTAIASGAGGLGMEKIHAENDAYEFRKNGEHPPVKVTTTEEADRLPPGTRIIKPDGNPGRIPARKR